MRRMFGSKLQPFQAVRATSSCARCFVSLAPSLTHIAGQKGQDCRHLEFSRHNHGLRKAESRHLSPSVTVRKRSSRMSVDSSEQGKQETKAADIIVQYVVIRRDLYKELKWPLGSVIAQGCHAATAALWESKDEECSLEYCSPESIDSMHKVVLEVKTQNDLQKLSEKLKESNIRHKLWMEQPENIPTSLAIAPYRKTEVHPLVKKLKLCDF